MSQAKANPAGRSYPGILVAVVVSLLLLLAIASYGGYRDLQAARQRQELLESKIEATRARNQELAGRIRRLQEEPQAIERLAREQYRMMRPDDVVVILPAEPEAPRTPSASPSDEL